MVYMFYIFLVHTFFSLHGARISSSRDLVGVARREAQRAGGAVEAEAGDGARVHGAVAEGVRGELGHVPVPRDQARARAVGEPGPAPPVELVVLELRRRSRPGWRLGGRVGGRLGWRLGTRP